MRTNDNHTRVFKKVAILTHCDFESEKINDAMIKKINGCF